MNSKNVKSYWLVKMLLGMIVIALMVVFMSHVGNSRQASFQETMKDSLIVAQKNGEISNYKVEKMDQGFYKCKYKVTVNRDSSSEKEIGIVETNFLSPSYEAVEFKF
jgi:hypothetical protein